MPVDTFGQTEFQSALEAISESLALPSFKFGGDEYRWAKLLKLGEQTYWMPLDEKVALEIRSNISPNGSSGSVGEDSIRVFVVGYTPTDFNSLRDARYLGSKLSHYTTRVKGWESRLQDLVGRLNVLRLLSGDCPKCGEPLGLFKVKKAGPNKGRLFASCREEAHKVFKWVEEP